MIRRENSRRPCAIVVIAVLATAAFVAVASVVQAVRHDSWGPILSVGWLPAVLVASLWTAAPRKPCAPRLRNPTSR